MWFNSGGVIITENISWKDTNLADSDSLEAVVRLKIERKWNYKSTWDKQEYKFLSLFLKVLFNIMASNSNADYLNYVTVLLTTSVYIVVVWVNSLLMTSTDDYNV